LDGFEWDALLHPRGPLPAGAYWLRRAVVGLVLVAVVVFLAVLVRGSRHTSTHVAQRPPPTTHAAPLTTVSRTPVAVTTSSPAAARPSTTPAVCGAGVQLALAASATNYPAGAAPTFTATVKNTGAACSVAGPLSIVVESGSDRVWSNTDCPAGTSAATSTALTAGGGASASRTWQRTRTSPNCATVNGTKVAAAGTYRASATWGGLTSAEVVFTLS
jgi:hypothetical protein